MFMNATSSETRDRMRGLSGIVNIGFTPLMTAYLSITGIQCQIHIGNKTNAVYVQMIFPSWFFFFF
ncbi:hypothetical protein L210DRAFT_313913 [Boletus edulis BED1]|uniref:Uncharacterized protein n=1 Tax=Boletus edulis BED1 TaxID=1328754 RepID=A0AAD4C4J5_BOLED|nr:hypothetical protein L210DRAFT_313913 [Boletus edulis BED1]